jgi:hypothetical protein
MRLLVVLVGAMLAVASGCGGTKALTRSELVHKADAVCRGVAEKRDRAYLKGIQKYVQVMSPLVSFERAAFARLAKLAPPAPMAEEWHQLLAIDHRVADDRARAITYAKAGQFALVDKEIVSLTQEEEQAAQIGQSDGFSYCSLVET